MCRPRSLALALAVVAVSPLLSLGTPTFAQITKEPTSAVSPTSAHFARGLYGEAEVGTMMFLSDARKQLGFGTALGARLGYDLLGWAAVAVHAFGSIHTADFGDAPQSGQLLQFHQGTAEAKLTLRLQQLALLAFGGGGLARVSTNLLSTVGLMGPAQVTPVVLGGAGVDYHTVSRHFSLGLVGTFSRYTKIHAPGALGLSATLRYTF